jgi:ligand-binding sensor domain-containing protein/serine phosphatase RsbU (regulator of sigma subunit)
MMVRDARFHKNKNRLILKRMKKTFFLSMNQHFTKLVPFFMLLFISVISDSQTYYFDNYGVREGLAQSKVYSIIQDKSDYLWLGTLDGVSRFDGFTFQNFNMEDGLAGAGVRAILQDFYGNIWLGHSGGGITRYNGKKFEAIKVPGIEIKSDITSISIDENNQIWISTDGAGVFVIYNPNASLSEMKFENFKGDKLSDRIFKICPLSNHSLVFITDVGLKVFNQKAKKFEKFQLKGLSGYFQITTMLEDHSGNLWFGTYHGGLYKFSKLDGKFKIYDVRDGLSSNWISSINEGRQGNIWVGTWGGGITLINDKEIKVFNTENGLQDSKIWCIINDIEGNVLIGTTEHGFSIYKGEQFITYTKSDGLINPQVWAVLQDSQNKYWFGTNEGISVFDPSKPKGKAFAYFNQTKNAISNQVRFVKEDKNHDVWVGSADQGVVQYKIKTSKFVYPAPVNINMPQDMMVTALEVDSKNNLWVGTTDGLVYYEINNNKAQRLDQTSGLAGSEISALYCDSKGTIWVGSKGKGLTSIRDITFGIYKLTGNATPKSIIEDKNGKLWIGTEGQGVIVFKDGKELRRYTQKDGILSNLITLVNVDKDNNVYIGTNKGLNRIDQKSNKIYTYTQKNGFVGIETRENASFCDKYGNIWFGTVNGVSKLNPALFKKSAIEPLTHITKLMVNLQQREMVDGMKLNYKENSIIIDYASICLTNPDAVQYQVMLEGADKDWQPVSRQSMVNYSALPSNKYVFKIKARNADGVWNTTPVTFHFEIMPPFYKTWWFIILCIIVGTSAIFAYIHLRERKLVIEKQVLEGKVKERTAEVVLKNEELAMKNKDITDSIRYAKRIQFAILPPEIPFKDTFILFKPKDIVSGDFYWLLQDDELDLLAAVDCTGHGVPGAFMSIIGHNLLNKIVKEYGIVQPGEILSRLNIELNKTFHQSDDTGNVNDGMDMSLICYHRKTRLLEFAGAYNPLWLVRNNELTEIRGDRFAIGHGTEVDVKFTNHTLEVQEMDSIYMFSDGYADQFGGVDGKKFKTKNMKKLIMSVKDKSINDQKQILDNTIESWRGDIVQIDDILVIGRRF